MSLTEASVAPPSNHPKPRNLVLIPFVTAPIPVLTGRRQHLLVPLALCTRQQSCSPLRGVLVRRSSREPHLCAFSSPSRVPRPSITIITPSATNPTRTTRFSGEPFTPGLPQRPLDHPVLYILLHLSSLPGSSEPYLRRSPPQLQTTSPSSKPPLCVVLVDDFRTNISPTIRRFQDSWTVAGKFAAAGRAALSIVCFHLIILFPAILLSQSSIKSSRARIDESARYISVD